MKKKLIIIENNYNIKNFKGYDYLSLFLYKLILQYSYKIFLNQVGNIIYIYNKYFYIQFYLNKINQLINKKNEKITKNCLGILCLKWP